MYFLAEAEISGARAGYLVYPMEQAEWAVRSVDFGFILQDVELRHFKQLCREPPSADPHDGGVGGVRSNAAPIPIPMVIRRCQQSQIHVRQISYVAKAQLKHKQCSRLKLTG